MLGCCCGGGGGGYRVYVEVEAYTDNQAYIFKDTSVTMGFHLPHFPHHRNTYGQLRSLKPQEKPARYQRRRGTSANFERLYRLRDWCHLQMCITACVGLYMYIYISIHIYIVNKCVLNRIHVTLTSFPASLISCSASGAEYTVQYNTCVRPA